MRSKEESDKLMLAAKFIQESNLIENIDIPLQTIWVQLGCGDPKDPHSGHAGALLSADIIAAGNKLLTEMMVCDWQAMIIREQNSLNLHPENIISGRHIGYYRDCGEFVGDKRCMPPQAVPICMAGLVEEINYLQKKEKVLNNKGDIVNKIADFHLEFLTIHPFVDGNGRTSRLLVWYLFKYFGLEPFIFTSEDKFETYYKAFDGMREYFLNRA